MKTLFTIGFLMLSISFSVAQEEVFNYPDLSNPKIQKIEKLLDAEIWDIDNINKHYDAIYHGSNVQDKLHLFIFDLSHPKGPFGDYLVKYQEEITPIFQAADKLPESDYKNFVTAVIYNRVAKTTYKDPEQKKNYLNSSFHTFLNLAMRGDNRSVIPLAWAASELYILDFKDDHLSEELILDTYNTYLTMGLDIKKLMRYLTDGLYYVNHFHVPLSEAEKIEKSRYKAITFKIIKNYLISFPEVSNYIIYDLWSTSLLNPGFSTHKVRYEPEIAKSLNQLINESKNNPEIHCKDIKTTDFLFRYFVDSEASLRLEDYVKLFDDRESAYDHLVTFLDEISKNDYLSLDFLTIKPQWATFFQEEIKHDLNRMFPYVVRYSDESSLFYSNSKIDVSTLKEIMKTTDKIINSMLNDNVDTGTALYTLYRYRTFMIELMKVNPYKNNSELKWELAKILLDFELSFLVMNQSHSTFVLGISSYFDNWTTSEIAKYKDNVKESVNSYLTNYRKMVFESLESEIVENEFAAILNKLGAS